MPTLATFPAMLERHRKREGLPVCRAEWLLGVTVLENRELEACNRLPSCEAYDRAGELFGWPETLVGRRSAP